MIHKLQRHSVMSKSKGWLELGFVFCLQLNTGEKVQAFGQGKQAKGSYLGKVWQQGLFNEVLFYKFKLVPSPLIRVAKSPLPGIGEGDTFTDGNVLYRETCVFGRFPTSAFGLQEFVCQRGRSGHSIFHYPPVCLTSQVNRASMFSQTVGDCGSMKSWNEYYVGKYFWHRGILAILSSKICEQGT